MCSRAPEGLMPFLSAEINPPMVVAVQMWRLLFCGANAPHGIFWPSTEHYRTRLFVCKTGFNRWTQDAQGPGPLNPR